MNPISAGRAAGRFDIRGRVVRCSPFGSGHIHDTYRVTTDTGSEYLLQRINHEVFRDVAGLMRNIERVTRHIRKRLGESPGHDPDRECLTLLQANDGKSFMQDEDGRFWRMLLFIRDGVSIDRPDNPAHMAEAGKGYGRFIRLVSDLPGERLNETIPAFHDMQNRLRNFFRAVQNDPAGRVQEAQSEIRWIDRRADEMQLLQRLVREGKIPERITHNDTKLNNVLFDASGKMLCVVDLDTVMPGCVHFDFGDAIRSGASTGAEDEECLDRISISLELYEAFARGFFDQTRDILTAREAETLAFSARMMTFIMGLRFMTDHLDGDRYYKIHHPGHNLRRARAQFRLVESMEEKRGEMETVIDRLSDDLRSV
jgi:Ser/Thr protein kinase RdoA (MazF antagonist)